MFNFYQINPHFTEEKLEVGKYVYVFIYKLFNWKFMLECM